MIDDRLRRDLGGRYDRHRTSSVGTDKITVTFTLRAATDADAIRSAGLAAGRSPKSHGQRSTRRPLGRRARRSGAVNVRRSCRASKGGAWRTNRRNRTGPAVDPVCLKGASPRRAERVSA